jgi:alpha-glucosidase
VDVIRAIPSVWDETVVLSGSKIGDLAVMARRRGGRWFVGILNGGPERAYSLDLGFLGEGAYACTELADDPLRPDALVRTEKNVARSWHLDVRMNAGGGYVAMFEPLTP